MRPDDPPLRLTPPVLAVVAHPDDETVGAGALLSRLQDVWIVHATDGAPRDARFRTFPGTREEYARVRREELKAAMALAGIGPDRLLTLEAADQEAVFEIPRLAREIARLVQELRPATVLTLAYEGGHPDHDAVALATRIAVREIPVMEMALYHATAQGMAVGKFLPGAAETRLELTDAERDLKRKMIAAFATQEETLRAFLPPKNEVFRAAPRYDFTKPPHEGRLQYEIWGFPITGEQWRRAAAETLDGSGFA